MKDTTPSPDKKRWLVLIASSPKQAEKRLLMANTESEQTCFSELFVPFTMIGAENDGRDLSKEKFSLRTALRRYIFVNGDTRVMQHLIGELNSIYDDKLFFLFADKNSRTPARISNLEKELLEKACREYHTFPNLHVPTRGFQVGDKLSLVGTPFEHLSQECEIMEVKPKSRAGSVEVRVRVMMFGLPFDNLNITFSDIGNSGERAAFIATTQKKLLEILRRRVDKKDTDVTIRLDEATLNQIYKDRNLTYKAGSMKRHYLSLMLICAHLLNKEKGVQRFTEAVQAELSVISQLRESKAATDTRAYLHIAMFIATGDPKYRTFAKNYVSKYNPTSPYLRKFVTAISKYSATKLVGPAARNKN